MTQKELRTEILKGHSKSHALYISSLINDNPDRFKILVQLILLNENIISQRAAWAMRWCLSDFPHLIDPYFDDLIKLLLNPSIHNAVKRNILAIMQDQDFEERYFDDLVTACLNILNNPKEAVAVKVFSMTILCKICKKLPDLNRELRIIIEDQMPYQSAGYQSRAKKVLNELRRF